MSGDQDPQQFLSMLRQQLDNYTMLLDVDGTLLDLAPTPREVYVSSELRHMLARLRERTKGATAFVSGRGINELDLIFAPLLLAAVGGHGAEFRFQPDGDIEIEKVQPLSTKTKQRFAVIAEAARGIIVEDKTYSIALHYRLAPDQEDYVRRAVAMACEELEPLLEILPGKAVVEVKQVGFNKATAVSRLMSVPPFRGRLPIFIGDDQTDEVVFPVIREFGGLGFSVGRQVAGVAGHFDTPSDVRHWLQTLAVGTTP